MSFKLIDRVCKKRKELMLSDPDMAVLIKIADLSTDNASPIFVDIKSVSRSISYSEETVILSLQSLLERNLILKGAQILCAQCSESLSVVYRINTLVFPEPAKAVKSAIKIEDQEEIPSYEY